MRFFERKVRENRHFFQGFSILGITNIGPNFNVYWSKALRSCCNCVKLFFKCYCNFGDNWKFIFKKWSIFWEFHEKSMSFKISPLNICLWQRSLVSMCSPLQLSLNAKRCFSHIRFVEEISAKYCLKLGFALKLNVYPIAQHKLPISKYTILL